MKSVITCLFLFLFAALGTAEAQTKSVSGRIISEKLSPLEGVQIMNSRTRVSETTNSQGIFSIKALPGDPLIFSYPGFIGSRKVIKHPNKRVNVLMLNEITDDFDPKLIDKKYRKLAKEAQLRGSWNYIVQN